MAIIRVTWGKERARLSLIRAAACDWQTDSLGS